MTTQRGSRRWARFVKRQRPESETYPTCTNCKFIVLPGTTHTRLDAGRCRQEDVLR